MRKNIDQTLRARGASDLLLRLLQEEDLLSRRRLGAVAMLSLRGIAPTTSRSAAIQDDATEKGASNLKAGRRPRARLQSAKVPPPHVQVLAALALSYL
jgi:hypothetical protein